MEVETPMLHSIPGGASARPFNTHHNALDIPLFLRIAPELYLKRLVVGGFERVFEINRCFRNEGISLKHNPEFTTIEFYQAWATYEDLMELTETLFVDLAKMVNGSMTVRLGNNDIDFTPPFAREDFGGLVSKYTGLTQDEIEDPSAMRAFWNREHGADPGTMPTSRGKWWDLLFDEYVEKHLVNPTFVTGYPAETSPLARRNDANPTKVDRFEIFAGTWEIGNAFTELNDPVDQAERFISQVEERDAGDEESMHFDRDYIRALSYAMPLLLEWVLESIGSSCCPQAARRSVKWFCFLPYGPEKWDLEQEAAERVDD